MVLPMTSRRPSIRPFAVAVLVASLAGGCSAQTFGEASGENDEAIIGGVASGPEDDAVAVFGAPDGVGFCSGTLIAPNLVLTAKHFVREKAPSPRYSCTTPSDDLGALLPAAALTVLFGHDLSGAMEPRAVSRVVDDGRLGRSSRARNGPFQVSASRHSCAGATLREGLFRGGSSWRVGSELWCRSVLSSRRWRAARRRMPRRRTSELAARPQPSAARGPASRAATFRVGSVRSAVPLRPTAPTGGLVRPTRAASASKSARAHRTAPRMAPNGPAKKRASRARALARPRSARGGDLPGGSPPRGDEALEEEPSGAAERLVLRVNEHG
jgi:hypothetical protein